MDYSVMQDQLRQAIELAQSGQRETARLQLRQITQTAPQTELAWLWLATVAESYDERVQALRQVVALNPNNAQATAALEKLGEPLTASVSATSNPIESAENYHFLERLLGRKFSWADYAGILLLVVVGCYVTFALLGGLGGDEEPSIDPTPNLPLFTATLGESPTPRDTATITLTPTLTPTEGPSPTNPPIFTLAPTWTPQATFTLPPTRTPAPSITPIPTETVAASFTPIPSRTRRPTQTPTEMETEVIPSETPISDHTPTRTPIPTATERELD